MSVWQSGDHHDHVLKSSHLMNTGNVAKAMAGAMNATLKKVGEARPEDLAGYGLVGIDSGT